jgi:hypothetical protein
MSNNLKFILIIVTVLGGIALLQTWMSGPRELPISSSEKGWQIARSPITGKCYEIFVYEEAAGYSGEGYMGMAEVSCDYLQEEK